MGGEGYEIGRQAYAESSKVGAVFRNARLYTLYPDLN
jgi:hypothetical protein